MAQRWHYQALDNGIQTRGPSYDGADRNGSVSKAQSTHRKTGLPLTPNSLYLSHMSCYCGKLIPTNTALSSTL
jgi:hypothetical protein